LSQWATEGLSPDLTVLLDLDPEIGLRRVTGPGDRLESETLAFHQRVRAAFLDLARHGRDRYLVVDVSETDAETVHELLLDRVLSRLVDLPSSRALLTMPLERVNP